MRLKLLITTNVDGDVFELVLKKSKYRVGRRFDNDLRIKETYISAYHSEIRMDGEGKYTLVDCGSSNGTFLNGVRVEEPVNISPGDYIKFGILKVKVVEHADTLPKVVALSERGNTARAKATNTKTSAVLASFSTTDHKNGTTGPLTSRTESSRTEDTQLVSLQQKVSQLETARDQAREEAAELRASAAKLKIELAAQEKLRSELTEEIDSKSRLVSTASAKAEKLGAELDNKERTTTKEDQKKLKDLNERIALLETELKEEKDKSATMPLKLEGYTSQIKKADIEIEELRKVADERKKAEEKAAAEAETLKKALAEEKAAAAVLAKELKTEASEISKLKKSLEDSESAKLSEVRKKEEELSNELVALQASLDSEKGAVTDKLTKLEADLKEAKSSNKSTSKEQAALAKKLKAAEAKLKKESAAALAFKSELAEKEVSLKELSANLAKNEKELTSKKKEIGKLSSEGDSVSEEIDALKKTIADKENEISDLEANSKKSSEGLLSDLATKVAALKLVETKLASKDEEIGLLSSKEESVSEEIEALKKTIADKEKEISALETDSKKSADDLQSDLAEKAAALKAVEIELASKDEEIELLNGKEESVSEEIEALKKTIADKEKEISVLETDSKKSADDLQSDLAKKEEALKEAEADLETVRNELADKDKLFVELDSNRKESVEGLETKLEKRDSELQSTVKELETVRKDLEKEKANLSLIAVREKDALNSSKDVEAKLEEESKLVEEIRAKLSKSEKENTKQSKLVSTLEEEAAEAKSAKTKASSLEKQLAEMSRLFQSELGKVADLQAQLDTKEDELSGLAASMEGKVDAEVSKLGEELKVLRAENAVLEADLQSISKDFDKEKASKQAVESSLKKEIAAAAAAAALVASLKASRDSFESEKVDEEKSLREKAERQTSELESKLGKAETSKQETEAKLADLNSLIEGRDDQIKVLKSTLKDAKSENASLTRSMASSEEDHSKLALENIENRRKIEEDSTRIAALLAEVESEKKRVADDESQRIEELQGEIETLFQSLDHERGVNCDLAYTLELTREGMSEVLRRAWLERDEQKAVLQLEENLKLSEVERSLSDAIQSREELSTEKHKLEDQLTRKEVEMEKLLEKIDDIDTELDESRKENEEINRKLSVTREGFSSVLFNTRNQVSDTRTSYVLEKKSKEEAEGLIAAKREEISQLIEAQSKKESAFERELEKWKLRLEDARSERSDYQKGTDELESLQDAIEASTQRKSEIEAEVEKLGKGMTEFRNQYDTLKEDKEKLLVDRNEMKSGLGVARSELNMVQKRCRETLAQEERLTQSIQAAEKRVETLKHLEGQLEHAVERKREENGLSRKDVFSDNPRNQVVGPVNGNEEILCRKLIGKLDMIDDLATKFDKKWRYPKVAEQLQILKGSFLDLLKEFSVNQFDLEPGTILSLEERKRIKLVPTHEVNPRKAYYLNGRNGSGTNGGGKSQVVETLRPGYVYRNGNKDVVIRKAEVIVG